MCRYQSVSSKAESLNGICETLLAEQVGRAMPSSGALHHILFATKARV